LGLLYTCRRPTVSTIRTLDISVKPRQISIVISSEVKQPSTNLEKPSGDLCSQQKNINFEWITLLFRCHELRCEVILPSQRVIHHSRFVHPPPSVLGPIAGSCGLGTGAVTLGCPEVGEAIGYKFLRPSIMEGLARETPVHLGNDGVESFWVATGRIVHYRVPAELWVSVCDSVRVHKFHSLDAETLSAPTRSKG
jgi:hypothetical protein